MLNYAIAGPSKSLRFKSYEDLKKNAEIDRKVLAQLKKFDLKKCFENFLTIELEARSRRQQGDEEESFLLYSRAMELFRLVGDKMDEKFKRSEDGRRFHDISSTMFMNVSLLSENLKKRYGDKMNANAENIHPTQFENGENSKISQSSLCIRPIDLVNIIEKEQTVVLLIDYRKDQNNFIQYKSSNGAINVVHLDPSCIVLGSLIHSLTKTLDISVRPFMEKIAQYDLVVLLGDSNDISKPTGSILYAALTTHNRNKLKRPPVVLENGFEAWKLVYPYYTASKCEIPQFEETFDQQFTNWIEESKKANKLYITYPNLYEVMENDAQFVDSTISNAQTNLVFPSENQNGKKIEPPKIQKYSKPKFSFNEEPTDQIKSYKKFKEKEENKTIPIVDRSKKPTEEEIKKNKKENGNDEIRRDILQDEMDYKIINSSSTAFPHRIQTIGGAQIDCNIDAAKREATIITPTIPQPRRPPTPDRSTKKNIPQNPQQMDKLVHFFNSYLMAEQKISEDSAYRKAETKCGHTGLVNMGNTCFMNATLQALFHTPGFSNLFMNRNVARYINPNNSLGTKGIISGCFAALMDLAWSGKFASLRPYFFLEIFAQRVNSTLANRQQHDAQEFQIYLLDALHEDTNKVDKRRPFEQNYDGSNLRKSAENFIKHSSLFSSSPVNDIFNLITISSLQCKVCTATSVCFESLNQISVELPENSSFGSIGLRDCLGTHFSATLLDALWDCPRCKCRRNAIRTTKIWHAPKILIIHLKRFSLTSGQFVKNEIDVNFDIENFKLAPFIHNSAPQIQLKVRYNLYAITNHSGTLNSGHYTSYVKNQQKEEWLYFDDENCTRRTPSTMSKQAFLLYYAMDIEIGYGKNMI